MTLYLALVVSAALAAAGQIMLKTGASGRSDMIAFVNPHVAAGLLLYAIGVAIWLKALSQLPLHVVYPFTMLTLGLVFAGSIVFLGERPGTAAIAGWIVIAIGVGIVALAARA